MESGAPDSEAGPGSPCRGLEWVVWGAAPARSPRTHPPGPVGSPAGSLPGSGPAPASWPIWRDLTTFLIKLVKRTKCHRNVSIRPVIVPNVQNGSRKSPLGFLRFPFLTAFSRKELMGRFDPHVRVYCQNDEVSPDVHDPDITRSERQIPPRSPTASCLLVTAPHLA